MSLSGRPLLDNEADAALFVDRAAESQQLDDALRLGLNVAVFGPAGAGATSLVRQAQRRWRSDGVPVAFVDGRAAATAAGVLGAVGAALGVAGTGVEGLRQAPGRPVAIVDGLPDPGQAHQLFGRQRDELWTTPVRWLVTARVDERAGLLVPPADAFFERLVTLPELSAADARALLDRRAGLDAATVERVLAASASRQPRALLDTARTAVAEPERLDALADLRAGLLARLREVGGMPAVDLAVELQQLGGASASDPRLLERLGWTRPHATRVLRALAEAGLVVATDVVAGAGRPRRVYALADPIL